MHMHIHTPSGRPGSQNKGSQNKGSRLDRYPPRHLAICDPHTPHPNHTHYKNTCTHTHTNVHTHGGQGHTDSGVLCHIAPMICFCVLSHHAHTNAHKRTPEICRRMFSNHTHTSHTHPDTHTHPETHTHPDTHTHTHTHVQTLMRPHIPTTRVCARARARARAHTHKRCQLPADTSKGFNLGRCGRTSS